MNILEVTTLVILVSIKHISCIYEANPYYDSSLGPMSASVSGLYSEEDVNLSPYATAEGAYYPALP